MLLSLGDCVHDTPPGPCKELLPDDGKPAILREFCSGVRGGERRGCRGAEQPSDSDIEPTKSPVSIADVQRGEGSQIEGNARARGLVPDHLALGVAVSPAGKYWFNSQAQGSLPQSMVNRGAPVTNRMNKFVVPPERQAPLLVLRIGPRHRRFRHEPPFVNGRSWQGQRAIGNCPELVDPFSIEAVPHDPVRFASVVPAKPLHNESGRL